ncbi:hypothetical protein crov239 [Cafeteria roenbergensis virus]|uniref:Hedgehog/Intein (Hint) domain-containing protein n=1 Tax=Cafeteria roenbergensis virus (strain BV-PW1) TaxID=693272 RepID=E3T509_CROVB|nr:hypothetical protein crov239 [Cafeteria roenbergensis virus BV-PW1]ADO67272.1 hypothetical protein crov239 [Cafeteria roenbergensis virus BV-PW1]
MSYPSTGFILNVENSDPSGRLFVNLTYTPPGTGNPWEGSWRADDNGIPNTGLIYTYVLGNGEQTIYENNGTYIFIEYDLTTTTTIGPTNFYHILAVEEVDAASPSAEIIYIYEGEYTNSDFQPINSFSIDESGLQQIPCLTNTCNILTPKGYQNVSSLNVNDLVITSDNRQVPIEQIFTSKIKASTVTPCVLKAHQYGKNQPIIDTFVSELHAYQVNGIWKLPKNENLTREWNEDIITYYHVKLPNYTQDFLVVNGLTMECWDGLTPHEIRPYKWVKKGAGVILKHLQ